MNDARVSQDSARSQQQNLRSPSVSSPGGFMQPSTSSFHRRSSSITSGISLGSSAISSPGPVGFNYGTETLGNNSIAELVDKNSKQQFRAPTSKDIPPVTLTQIKKIKRGEFVKYLNTITADYDDFYEAKMAKNDTPRRPSREVTPLSSIPDVFFEDKFQLDNPRVFDVVSENSDIVRNDDDDEHESPRKVLANNTILQERLTWYIDTVELHLINEISNASASFFSALDDLKDIKSQASECVDRIQQMRHDLKIVDEKRAQNGIDSLKLKQRKHNVSILGQSLEQIQLVLAKSDEAESLLKEKNQVGDCLDTVDAVESLIAGNSSNSKVKEWVNGWAHPVVDLRSIQGLNDLRENLCTLRNEAGATYGTAFANSLIKDLQTHYESVPTDRTLTRLATGKGTGAASLDVSGEFRKELEQSFEGLRRSDNVTAAFQQYRELVIRDAKNVVRMNLPSQSDASSMSSNMTSRSANDKSNALRSALLDMSPEKAEEMVRETYTTLSELFRRLQVHQKLLLDITSSAADESMPLVDLSEIVTSVVRLSIQRMVKVLKARQLQVISDLSVQQFINYFRLNHVFLTECENICGDTGDELRAMMSNQIKSYVQAMHRRHLEDVQISLERDSWKVSEIAKDVQTVVDRLVQCSEKVPELWSNSLNVFLQQQQQQEDQSDQPGSGETQNGESTPTKILNIDDSSFYLTKAATSFAKYLERYLMLANAMPHLANEIAGYLNDLMNHFSQNVNELILQAKIVRVDRSQLKHITARHLSLAYESLDLAVTLVPYLRECLRRYQAIMQSKLGELDSTKRAMQEIQEEIRNKFIKLMEDRVNVHATSISKLDWTADNGSVNDYMVALCKDVRVLVKVVRDYLPKQVHLDIIARIFDIYKRRLLEAYTQIEFKSKDDKERMLRDVEYFAENLGYIEGTGNALQVVLENVRAMPAPEDLNSQDEPQPEPPKEPEPEAESQPETESAQVHDETQVQNVDQDTNAPSESEPELPSETQVELTASPTPTPTPEPSTNASE